MVSSGLGKYKNIICQSVPSLLAILLLEVVNIEIYNQGTFSSGSNQLLYWVALQMIPGFLFSYISDLHFRKTTLIVSQVFGLFGSIVLLVFGFDLWVLALIGLTFNPLPVARAAFLDNFPQYSRLKLMAITFLAQFGPLAFHSYFELISYEIVIFWVLIAISINVILTVFLFHDNYDKKEIRKERSPANFSRFYVHWKTALFYTLVAFMLAEVTFYLLWAFLENNPLFNSWLSTAVIATIVGICIAMFYTRLPHFSSIGLFYNIGFGITLVALFQCLINPLLCGNSFVGSMSVFAVIGGLYLPFVADAAINMAGPKRKAIGAALIEFAGLVARFVAVLFNFIFNDNAFAILLTIVVLYLLATSFQRYAERVSVKV